MFFARVVCVRQVLCDHGCMHFFFTGRDWVWQADDIDECGVHTILTCFLNLKLILLLLMKVRDLGNVEIPLPEPENALAFQ